MTRELTLFFHLIGFGLLFPTLISGMIINGRSKRASDHAAKSALLQAMRPIGLLSPLAMVIILITGIMNMNLLGVGVLTLGWLTAKIIFFTIAVISGILFGAISRRRAALVENLGSGIPEPGAEAKLRGYDRQITLYYLVMTLLILVILYLSMIGRFGGQ
jgi:uncharacterized membrane protein